MLSFRVRVIARYPTDVQLWSCVQDRQPPHPSEPLHWETSAVQWNTHVGPDMGPYAGEPWQTLTVVYDVEGRNAEEASRFAHAIFECERQRAALPAPATLAVFPE
jgi:hypothetical protein